jgi:hypothetical protein
MNGAEEFTLINSRCMVYGHEVNDKGFCTRESCYFAIDTINSNLDSLLTGEKQ